MAEIDIMAKNSATKEISGKRRRRAIAVIALFTVFGAAQCFSAGLTAECAFAAEGYEDVAGSSEMGTQSDIGKYGMIPVYPQAVKKGTYDIDVESTSRFFRVRECKLTVRGGKMTAVIMIDSLSYECVYMGTGREAATAPEEDYIFAEEKDNRSYFTVPVEALDTGIDCAAFSRNERKWYDRKLLFDASSLPEDALAFDLPDYDLIDDAVEQYDEDRGTDTKGESSSDTASGSGSEPAYIKMDTGTYSIEVNMTGGSGRASVSSPTWFIVKDNRAYARLLWSSANYDYMIVGGKKYMNEADDGGNSVFTIPVTAFDRPVSVIADTTAMGEPLEITYTLTFYMSTIDSESQVPQEAAKRAVIVALVIVVCGGILNVILKRRKKQ